jgi:hypothetical protein
MKVIKELEPVDVATASRLRRRIVIVQRRDMYFSFAEEYFYISEYDDGEVIAQGWARLPPEGIYQTDQMAEAEGRATFARRHKLPT